ncbi:MAG: PKD domain-containing protein, partial [Bacteroidia bacterium]
MNLFVPGSSLKRLINTVGKKNFLLFLPRNAAGFHFVKLFLLCFSFFTFSFSLTNAQVVTTLAGSSSGDANGTGTAATFSYPAGVTTDGNGNLFIADDFNYKVREIVISSGVVTTLAGSGNPGSTNGTGSAASFYYPTGVAVDGSGNLYVADSYDNEIRKVVISSGVVTTFAGSTASGSANGTGTAAGFNSPVGVMYDGSGDLYVADASNNEIRKIVISTAAVTTFAGSTTSGSANGTGTAAGFHYPTSLTIDGSGNIYVSDYLNDEIRKIVISSAAVTTLAGSTTGGSANGTGTAAGFDHPAGVAYDGSGNLYIGDETNNEIRKIVISSAAVTTYAGSTTSGSVNGTGTAASFDGPYGVVTDAGGNVYVCDQYNDRIRKIAVNAVAPVAAFTANITSVCTGGTVQFTDNSSNSPTSWSWTFQGGTPATSNQENPSVVYSTAGTYSVSLTATNSSGSNTLNKTAYITVNNSPTVTISGTTTICDGSSTTLTATGASTYSWTGGPATASYTVTPATTTTYTVTGTSTVTGCAATATQAVTVTASPTLIISGTTTICDGSSTTLTATGANTYSWTGGPATASYTVTPATTTTYTVTGTNTVTGCTATATKAVTVNALPTITISGTTTICDGSNTTLTAGGANTYTWAPSATLSASTGVSVKATPTTTTTYTITGTNTVTSCSNTATQAVTVNNPPTVPTAGGNSPICAGTTLNLTATSTGATSYSWTGPNGFTSTSQNPSITATTTTDAGTYSVKATNSCGTTTAGTVSITINASPTVTISGTTTICDGSSTTLTAGGANTYSWTGGPATAAYSVSPAATTTYTVTG